VIAVDAEVMNVMLVECNLAARGVVKLGEEIYYGGFVCFVVANECY